LDLSGNLLNKSVPELFQLKFLKKLSISNNKISNLYPLPEKLEFLDLSHNLLCELDLTYMGKLKTLDISFNGVFSLLGLPTQLKYLYAKSNRIESVFEVPRFKNLLELDLSYNNLNSVKFEELVQVDSLNLLNLAGNPLEE